MPLISRDDTAGVVLFGDVATGVKLPAGGSLTLRPSARQAGHHSSAE